MVADLKVFHPIPHTPNVFSSTVHRRHQLFRDRALGIVLCNARRKQDSLRSGVPHGVHEFCASYPHNLVYLGLTSRLGNPTLLFTNSALRQRYEV